MSGDHVKVFDWHDKDFAYKIIRKVSQNDYNNIIKYTLYFLCLGKIQMDGLKKELWDLSWADGIAFTIVLMGLYTYKVWIDNKFKK